MSRKTALTESAANERAYHFLKVLIERYIQDGHPIGSRTLARELGQELSPATVRNVMADLEDMGLVSSPHTSAGRVPTQRGYRIFLDSLLTLKPLRNQEMDALRTRISPEAEPTELIASTSQLLSGITRMAGVVRLPRRNRAEFRQIDLLPLSSTRVLAVLVTNEDEVSNRILHTNRKYSRSELERAARYLTQRFSGSDLNQVRVDLIEELREARSRMDQIMIRAIEMAEQVVEAVSPSDQCRIDGQTNLMEFNDLADMERLKQLFDAFTEKQQILHLLDRCMDADGVQIFIGEESGYQILGGCSVVTAPYQVNDRVVGVLGVIGPTRMDYERVIPIVDVTARLLSAALKPR